MFQFPGLAWSMTISLLMGFPIRKSTDRRLFAPPRSLSQLITSFFASESQGIPHAPFSSRCTFQEVYDLLVYFRLAFALPYLAASRCFLEPPGASRCGARCVLLFCVCSQCSVTYTASPVCQCTRFLVPAVPVRTAAGGFRPVVLGRVELPTSTLSV